MLERELRVPDFIKAYLAAKFRRNLILALGALLASGLLALFLDQVFGWQTGGNWVAAGSAALLAYSIILFVVFSCRVILIHLNLKGSRCSKMYRVLKQYGDPARLLHQLNLRPRKESPLVKDQLQIDESFVVLPYTTYVYIAPIEHLIWAYVALVATPSKWMHYYIRIVPKIRFHFSSKDDKSAKLEHEKQGIELLHTIKQLNPNVLLGFSNEILPFFYPDSKNPKQKILDNLEELQQKISLHDKADMISTSFRTSEYYRYPTTRKGA